MSLGETDCCGFNVFNVYSVAVQIEIYKYLCEHKSRDTTKQRNVDEQGKAISYIKCQH